MNNWCDCFENMVWLCDIRCKKAKVGIDSPPWDCDSVWNNQFEMDNIGIIEIVIGLWAHFNHHLIPQYRVLNKKCEHVFNRCHPWELSSEWLLDEWKTYCLNNFSKIPFKSNKLINRFTLIPCRYKWDLQYSQKGYCLETFKT